jgi:membrane-associated protease RseP (regulator of RpoE activity)
MYGLVASTGTFFSPIQTLGLIIFWTLEVVAYSIIMAFSFRLLFSFLFPKRIYKKDIRRIQSVKLTLKGFKKIFLVAVLFLLIGAIVETIVVISIKTSGILYKNIFEECGITFQGIIPNSPAERSGLKPFTRIVKINNESVYNLTNFLEVLKKYKPEELIIFESGTGQKFYVKLEPPIESNKTVFIGLENVYTAFVKKGRCL